MLRRLLVLGGLGLTAAIGARWALAEVTERAWARRREELLALAIRPSGLRRPWELRFEALELRASASERHREVWDSPYLPHVALGSGAARPLDDFERVWLDTAEGELDGLDSLLAALRLLPREELAWNGETASLMFLRECVDVLCVRAWLALEEQGTTVAARAYADALALARATDDGTVMGTAIRCAAEGIVLRAIRASLGLGASATTLSAELGPCLEGLGYDPARAERALRRDLGALEAEPGPDDPWAEPAFALAFFRPIEAALEDARRPMAGFTSVARIALDPWEHVGPLLRDQHARRNVALSALAVAAHRERTGAFPAALEEIADLARDHACDPFTGNLLPYERSDQEARIGPASRCDPADEVADDGEGSLFAWPLR